MNRTEINAQLKRTNIKGKDYVEVNQRILAFWEMFPDGQIVTEKLSDSGDRCDFKATIVIGGKVAATGHAFETKSASMVNKTSYVENCETSAIGRALGILGIGITESLASAEEVEAAISQQQASKYDEQLKKAQGALWTAETRYCELMGIQDPRAFHKSQIMKREDYANEPDTLLRIAQELRDETEVA